MNNIKQVKVKDDWKNINHNNNLILKSCVDYISKVSMKYKGRQNSVFFFSNGTDRTNQRIKKISFIVVQQQFALNGQMKIIKKCKVDYHSITFMNQSNKFISQIGFETSIWKINGSYNFNIVQAILTYQNEPSTFIHNSFYTFLLLSEKDNLIITSVQNIIYFLIKDNNENWNLQQRIEADQNFYIKDYQLNCQGNILILSFLQILQNIPSIDAQYKLVVVLRVDGIWKIIHEIRFQYQSYSSLFFMDSDKFVIFNNDCNNDNLQIWQVCSETLEVKQLFKQILQFSNLLTSFRFMKQRNLLIAYDRQSIFAIKKDNNQFSVQQRMMLPEDQALADIINEQLIIFQPPIIRIIDEKAAMINKIKISKLYGD